MAASYAAGHADEPGGSAPPAAYSTQALTDSELTALSLYGSEGGGCHAGFDCYGAQDGDGTPAISSNEQIEQTAEGIARTMGLASR